MANVVILGAGLMGSAFSTPLADNGHAVRLVGTHLDDEIIEEIHDSGIHPRLRVKLPAAVSPYSYDRLGEAMAGADLVVVGVNSLGVEWASFMLGDLLSPDIPLLMLTKGLEGDGERLHLLPELLRSGLPPALHSSVQIAAIGGPSIAGELAVRRHTCVVITGQDRDLLERLAALIRTPYYHVWPNTDFVGVEVSVAMKNVYALAVGIVGGLLEKEGTGDDGYVMHNLAAAIFAQGLGEMAYLVEEMGGDRATVLGLPGAGDLYVTSMGGRNGRMGRWLGLGHHYIDAKKKYMAAETIEGAELALAIGPTIEEMVYRGKLDARRLPLLRAMIQVVCNDALARIPWDDFFAR
ncbi:MAG: glycerol-3-phosphate dehydrogenase [Caldilineaceae bacterium]|nr:glycerol-3-phosphate dehydrogenase [Caldilineaceae bacterium]